MEKMDRRSDTHWEADSRGALIHAKGLEIVRNIYAEVYKTADYRERMKIKKYAIKSESARQRENFVRAARCASGAFRSRVLW
jgi:putative DNA primase/helicase